VLDNSRVAIYYAPTPDSALWRLASQWLGRDAVSGQTAIPTSLPAAWSAEWPGIVKSPRHYGFHATLKPPFELRQGFSRDQLIAAAQQFAEDRKAFTLPGLRLSRLGSFLALTEAAPSPELHQLAADSVVYFEPFRQPPTEAALAARRHGIADARQLELISQWGYPYVMDQWKFHMTLTSSLDDALLRDQVREYLGDLLAPILEEVLPVDAICVYAQESREQPFHLLSRLPFSL
jgi:putative phosphonate metabolism protein